MKSIKADKKEDIMFRAVLKKLGIVCDVNHETQTPHQFHCPFTHKKDIDSALSQLSDIVLGEKKKISKECPQPYSVSYEDKILKIVGWNACCDHISNLILRGGK